MDIRARCMDCIIIFDRQNKRFHDVALSEYEDMKSLLRAHRQEYNELHGSHFHRGKLHE